MNHWRASSLAGLLLTGLYRPVCAWVHGLPDSAFRRGFIRATDWWFGEIDHARRVAPGWDIHYLEREWRDWVVEPPRDADSAFVGFCRKWFEKRGNP